MLYYLAVMVAFPLCQVLYPKSHLWKQVGVLLCQKEVHNVMAQRLNQAEMPTLMIPELWVHVLYCLGGNLYLQVRVF